MKEQPVFYRDLLSLDRVLYRMIYRQELEKRVGRKFWKSQDVSIAEDFTLGCGYVSYVPLFLPSNLAPFEGLPVDVFCYASASTRSRYAHIGVDVLPAAGQVIAETLENENYPKNGGKIFRVYIPVANNSNRPIHFSEGSGLFRLYIDPRLVQPQLIEEGERLSKLVENGEIRLSGQKGKDWMLQASGIVLKIDTEKRMWIPQSPDNSPLQIPDETGIDYRAIIDQYSEPVPRSSSLLHWRGETVSTIQLGTGINALIDRNPSIDGDVPTDTFHGNSLIIDEGFNGTIRTEIISPTDSDSPNYILLGFFKDFE